MPKDTFLNLNCEKQEKIMRSAINEFSNKGFEKGNVGNIAKNAGVAKGSMYQYFENKKELFLYSVQWATKYIMAKYSGVIAVKDKNPFDYFYNISKVSLIQLREERELVIFIQDVFLGRYMNLTNESMGYMLKASDEYVLKLIQEGKRNGYIRKDIDDNILSLFMTGASMKIKEYMMNKARNAGEDIIDMDYEIFENDIKDMMELLKNGMGEK